MESLENYVKQRAVSVIIKLTPIQFHISQIFTCFSNFELYHFSEISYSKQFPQTNSIMETRQTIKVLFWLFKTKYHPAASLFVGLASDLVQRCIGGPCAVEGGQDWLVLSVAGFASVFVEAGGARSPQLYHRAIRHARLFQWFNAFNATCDNFPCSHYTVIYRVRDNSSVIFSVLNYFSW